MLFILTLFAGGHAAKGLPAAGESTPGLAQEAQSLQAVCSKCHSLQIVRDTPKTFDEWRETVQKMVDLGARGTDEQFDDIMDYLHRTMTTINVNTADAGELQIVLDLPEAVAQAIIARRTMRKFADLADLETVAGVDAASIDQRVRLIQF